MLLADLDATVAHFGNAAEAMTANLVELESNPTNKLLDPAGLTGLTKDQVTRAHQTLVSLWEHFSEFKDLLDKARTLRGSSGHVPQKQFQELEALLTGPSITLPPIDVPLASRGLYQPSQTPVATTPSKLLDDMGAAFDTAKGVILAVDEAWRTLVPRLSAARDEIEALASLATTPGETNVSLDHARIRIEALSAAIGNDPLSVNADDFAQVEATLSSLRSRLNKLASDRDTLERDLQECGDTLAEISAAVEEGEGNLTETRAKIHGPVGLLAPLGRSVLDDPERGLGPWLERLRRLASEGNWRSACSGVDQWQRFARDTLTAAHQVADTNAAPLRQRNELRGRLDALGAKAEALGLTEDPHVTAVREQARAALFTAPTDLLVATELLSEYGASMSGGSAEPAPRS